jgi:hypothetical protein
MTDKYKTCWELRDAGGYPITLEQLRPDCFRVSYGLQVRSGLTYAQAAMELGSVVMHLLACEGRLDNRTADDDL